MKYIWIILGFLSFGIGAVGVIIPILPTAPFLLLSSFCFAKGSNKFHNWFLTTKLYKKHLHDFVQSKSMTLKTKISLLSFASFMLLVSFFILNNIYGRIFIIIIIIIKYYYFIFKIKTI